MTEEKKYIYSIIRKPQKRQALDDSYLSGINNRDISFIFYRDIAAVVSNNHLINFDKLDRKELAYLVSIHERVNTGLMKDYDVIPLRFGMVAENTEKIYGILTKAYIQFKTALEKVAGKTEFVVQVLWNEKNALEKIVQENAEIQELKKETESKGKILGFSSKLKLGRRVFEAIESRRKECVADILRTLANYFPDFSAGKLLDTDKENIYSETDKKIIMNHSFLVGKMEESALEFQLNKLAEKYGDELKFKCIGPMAPYSFAVINLGLGNFDLVENARQILGLRESALFSEIRDAYYKKVRECHPDKYEYKNDQAVLEEAEKKTKDAITANEILTVYCKHYLSTSPPSKAQFCSFRKEDVENSIIIKEK